jgi:hypothetical protein
MRPVFANIPDRLELLQEALTLRSWCRFSIIPVRGKHPVVPDWKRYQNRRPSDRELSRDFAPCDVSGLAVVFGPGSGGLAGRDFDTEAGYLEWSEAHPEIAGECPTVKTPRGYLVLCRLRGQVGFGRLDFSGRLKGELRVSGCYSLLPPSLHPCGQVYRWVGQAPSFDTDFPRLSLEATGFIQVQPRSGPMLPKEPSRGVSIAPVFITPCAKRSDQPEIKAKQIQDAVLRSIPTEAGRRHGCIFGLAMRLRQIGWKVDPDSDDFRTVFDRWWELAEPRVRTKDPEVSLREFSHAWRDVRLGIHAGRIGQAIAWRLAQPLPESPLPKFDDEPTRKLVAVCEVLQEVAGREPFYLSCRDAAAYCGFATNQTASNRLKSLVKVGVLEVVKAGIPSATVRVASTYRYARPESGSSSAAVVGGHLAA